MTGGTSGFGVPTTAHLREAGCRVLLGSREAPAGGHVPDQSVGAAGHDSPAGALGDSPAEALGLDLSALGSVRSFADAVRDRLGGERIAALVLNAGIVRPDAAGRSADGHELTFAVNHLAHYLLLRLLLDRVADGGTVVMTTSGTHDPQTGAGLAPPRHAAADLLSDPARDPEALPATARAGQHAYTASKLCVLLTVRHLASLPAAADRDITVLAYCPGQVFGTGLATGLGLPRRIAWAVMGTPVSAPLRRFVPTLNTARTAGLTLGRLALGQDAPPTGRTYAALRHGRLTWPDPSELARDENLGAALWRDSADLVGLPA